MSQNVSFLVVFNSVTAILMHKAGLGLNNTLNTDTYVVLVALDVFVGVFSEISLICGLFRLDIRKRVTFNSNSRKDINIHHYAF